MVVSGGFSGQHTIRNYSNSNKGITTSVKIGITILIIKARIAILLEKSASFKVTEERRGRNMIDGVIEETCKWIEREERAGSQNSTLPQMIVALALLIVAKRSTEEKPNYISSKSSGILRTEE